MIKLDYLPYYPSPNRSVRAGGAKPTHIILHAMVGFYGTQKSGTIALFMNPKSKVSAHYLVSRKGEICNMVKDSLAAWHVKNFNSLSLGIEFEDMIPGVKGNCMTNPNWHTPEQLKAGAELVATLMKKHNIPLKNVMQHSDPFLRAKGNDHTDCGPFFNEADFKLLIQGFLDAGSKPK